MLSFTPISNGAGAAKYYENLAREDYYTGGGEPPGKWVGEHAERLGLQGEVKPGDLEKIFKGYHPQTGEALAKNAGPDHRPGYDMTFSAPKSVSTVWAVSDKDTQTAISAAQQRAAEKALGYLAEHGFRQREGHAGAVKVDYKDGLVCSTFEHGTSREGDPQLHTHALVANLSSNGKTIDFDSSWKMAAGAVYRAELAHELQRQGFTVERDGSSFKLAGVPDKLADEFSTRRQQIEAAMREAGTRGGKAAAAATLATRVDKGEVNRADLFERVREVAREHCFDVSQTIGAEVENPPSWSDETFLAEITAQASTLTRQQVETVAYQAAQGALAPDVVAQKIADLKARGELVELVDREGGTSRYTTRDMLEIERRIGDTAERMAQEETFHVDSRHLETALARKADGTGALSPDQEKAFHHILGPERITIVQGMAGAGKSYMLDAARDAWQRAGYVVVGAALSGKAAEGLEKSAGIESSTIHSLLGHLDTGRLELHSKSVVVIDEAGMVGSLLYDRLQTYVDQAGAKIVLVGETLQLQPIDAGGAMRLAEERAGSITMENIVRQKDEFQREIVRDFRAGDAEKAMIKLESIGCLRTYADAREAQKGAAQAVVKDLAAGKTAITMAGTRAEVRAINAHAREAAREAGLLKGEDREFRTTAGVTRFAEGDRVIFLENDSRRVEGGEVKNGTTGTVLEARDGVLRVQLDGTDTVITARDGQYQNLTHGYAMTTHKAQGVTVDRAHLVPGRMADRHWSYVAASRHRETVKVHGTKEGLAEFRQAATRLKMKDTSADKRFTPVERQVTAIERAASRLEQAKEAFAQRVAELRQPKDATPRHFETSSGAQKFAPGDRVTFLKDSDALRVEPGTAGTVERAKEGNLVVKLDDGRRVEFGDKAYCEIKHAETPARDPAKPEPKPIEKAGQTKPEPKPVEKVEQPKPEQGRQAEPVKEPAKLDQVRQDAKVDQVKHEQGAQLKVEAKLEPSKIEQARQAEPKPVEVTKQGEEPAKAEQVKQDPAKPERARQAEPKPAEKEAQQIKVDQPKPEARPAVEKVEQPKPEKGRQAEPVKEPAKLDQVRQDAKVDQVKHEQGAQLKVEAKLESPKIEQARQAEPKPVEPAKAEQVKQDPAKPEQARQAEPKPVEKDAQPIKVDQPKPEPRLTPDQAARSERMRNETQRQQDRKPERSAQLRSETQRQRGASKEREAKPERQPERAKTERSRDVEPKPARDR